MELSIRADSPLQNAVVLNELPAENLVPGYWQAQGDGGEAHPAQVTALANGKALVGVYVAELAAGDKMRVRLEGR